MSFATLDDDEEADRFLRTGPGRMPLGWLILAGAVALALIVACRGETRGADGRPATTHDPRFGVPTWLSLMVS